MMATGFLLTLGAAWQVPMPAHLPFPLATQDGTVLVPLADHVLGHDGVQRLFALDVETGERRWAFGTFDAEAAKLSLPTIESGTAFVGSDDQTLYALDLETGAQRWAFQAEGALNRDRNGPVFAPVVLDRVVYVATNDTVHAVDVETGDERWAASGSWRIEGPLVVLGDAVFARREGDYGWDAQVVALDAATGAERWAAATGSSAEELVAAHGIVGAKDHGFTALDAATGRELWTRDGSFMDPLPVLRDGLAVFSTDVGLVALDARTGEERWALEYAEERFSPAAVAVDDGLVFLEYEHGKWDFEANEFPQIFLKALDAATGEEQWAVELDGGVEEIVAQDGAVFVGSFSYFDGTVAERDRATGAEKWAVEVEGLQSMAVRDGVVVGRTSNKEVLAIDAATGQALREPAAAEGPPLFHVVVAVGAAAVALLGAAAVRYCWPRARSARTSITVTGQVGGPLGPDGLPLPVLQTKPCTPPQYPRLQPGAPSTVKPQTSAAAAAGDGMAAAGEP